jgi:6-pyruvoyltetrahydropterin/6-carboxytetrahydropterin synthase
MISITKIFRFEAAHAIHHYPGSCAHIHGHSYELHVTVQDGSGVDHFIPGLGIVMDFKDLKTLVQREAVELLDHKLILSKAFLAENKTSFRAGELTVFDVEPTAENLLIFLRDRIKKNLPQHVRLVGLRLWETRDSFAEWLAT